MDPVFRLPLPDLPTRSIDHRPPETLSDCAVIRQAPSVSTPVPVLDVRSLIVITLDEPQWVQPICVTMAFENQRFESMLTPAWLMLVAVRLVIERLVKRCGRADGDALSPGLAEHQGKIPGIDPPLQTRMVDSQELRGHGTSQHIAKLTFDLSSHGRYVAVTRV